MTNALQRVGLCALASLVIMLAARSAAAQSAGSDKLQPLAFLAGSCWKGTFPGRAVTDEHCFEWMYGGRFLRDRHVVKGDSVPYEGESTYAWDAKQRRIVFWYLALPGFYSHGQVDPDQGALLFRDSVVTAGGTRLLRTTWRSTAHDKYTVRVEEVTGGTVKELWSMEMIRQP